jgi:major membrane immunogen (membrane-anchored lipoprotein)
MIKSKLVIVVVVVMFLMLLSGCIGGDAEYTSNISIINESGKNLSLYIYGKNGIQTELIMNNNVYKNRYEDFSFGQSPFVGVVDSLIIRFEDEKKNKYTYKDPEKTQNILWLDAYEVQVASDYIRNYTYRITEQHYLSAK